MSRVIVGIRRGQLVNIYYPDTVYVKSFHWSGRTEGFGTPVIEWTPNEREAGIFYGKELSNLMAALQWEAHGRDLGVFTD